MNERRTDVELLRDFARRGDQESFAVVVRRHIDLVYATALRKLENEEAAEEATQNVFATLARKAWQFAPDDSLPAWLYRTALLEAKEWWRGELRRRRREQTAAELGTTMKTPDEQSAFRALVSLLDEALLSLREKDRAALLLRFYESQSLRDVGASLGVSEDSAQKRVAGALAQLAGFFQRRGFKAGTVAATATALQHTAASAPSWLAASVLQAAARVAPPALLGLKPLFGRLMGLTRVQKVLVCSVLLVIPWAWHWTAVRNAKRIEQQQAESRGVISRQETQRTTSVRPRSEQITLNVEALNAPTVEESRQEKEYSLHLWSIDSSRIGPTRTWPGGDDRFFPQPNGVEQC